MGTLPAVALLWTLRGVDMGDGRIPSGIPTASMTMPFDCHFAGSGARPVWAAMPRSGMIPPPCGGANGSSREGWCGRWESNPHSLRNGILNPARLPIPPRPRCDRPIAPPQKRATANISNRAYVVVGLRFDIAGVALAQRDDLELVGRGRCRILETGTA